MEKKSKKSIVIGAVTLLLVTLTLLGLTYAYYRTRIIGNETEKTVYGTVGKLELTYGDGNGTIIAENAEPGSSYEKTFKITNSGTLTTSYMIILEDIANNFNNGKETRGEYEDWTYELYRIKFSKTEDGTGKYIYNETLDDFTLANEQIEDGTATYDYTKSTLYSSGKITDNQIQLLHTDEINASDYRYFLLNINYTNLENVDQSEDMGQSLSLKVNITDINDITEKNQYNEGTLAYTLISNAQTNAYFNNDGTTLVTKTPTTAAKAINNEDEKVMSIANDDYGISYYYRGNVADNYINYAGMCWRIVRIQGDGSIKLVLEDQTAECNSVDYTGNWNVGTGYFGYEQVTTTSGRVIRKAKYLETIENTSKNNMSTILYNFQNKLSESGYLEQLKAGDWCYNDNGYQSIPTNYLTATPLTQDEKNTLYDSLTSIYYDSYVRIVSKKQASYKCPADINGEANVLTKFNYLKDGVELETDMYVGALTMDEAAYAGATGQTSNSNYYLINDEFAKGTEGTIASNRQSLISLDVFSGNGYEYTGTISNDGTLSSGRVYNSFGIRPSIILKSDVVLDENVTGQNGTKANPYVIKSN